MSSIARAARALAAWAAIATVGVVACSGSSAAPDGASACVSSTCVAGNSCIATAGDAASQCRLPCATSADCPASYHCDANAGGTSPYCAADATQYPPESGQWGDPCAPPGGIQANPACDTVHGFACFGVSTTDANAFCTQYGCASDADCGHGWWCARLDRYPNLTSDQVTTGETWTVCLARTYCSPCTSDVDCSPIGATFQHCLEATDGTTFCAPECTSDDECALDAECTAEGNYAACVPRAGVCVGDGTLCAPCRSDADCVNGSCVLAYESTEHFCATRSTIPCTMSGTTVVDGCPQTTAATSDISCSVLPIVPPMPANLCIGMVTFGGDDQPGCWSVH